MAPLIGDFLGGIEKDLEVVIEKITKNPHLHADYVEKLLLPQLAMYRSEPFQTSLKRLMSVLEDFEAEFYPCTTAVSVSDYAASWARVYKKILSCEPLNRLIQADLPHLPCECIFLRQREEEFLQNHPKSRLEIDSYLKSREEIMGALPSGDVLRKFYFLFKRIMKNKEILKRNFSDVSVNLAFEDERSVRTGVERIFHEREIGARITGIDDLKAELNTEETEFLKLLSDTDRELVEAEYSERCSLVDEALAKYEKLLLQFPYSYYLRDKFNILKSKRRS
ncbi:MAG: hypothetical protein IPJ69_02525 [Deltaproteobacteria bacterium]|nr:MAG: hypothetical protein IPJ69_02525 [Deltaproteobacteria bacterium]